MSDQLNPSALEPLFAPWEEPNSHRVRADNDGEPAKSIKGRRTSPIRLAQNIRGAVREWRVMSSETGGLICMANRRTVF